MTPSTAPWFYRPTLDPRTLARNAIEYLDRGVTFVAALTGVAALLYGWRSRTMDAGVIGRRYMAAAIWFTGGYALTVWLPVRSSLYALLPAVGSALACAAACDAMRTGAASLFTRDLRMAAALACVLLLIPIYQRRNDRWVEPARLSARASDVIVANPPGPGLIVLEEDAQDVNRSRYSSFTDAFGDVADVAVSVLLQRPTEARIVTRPARWSGHAAARYKLTGGRIERIE
jgi:hypothetical protein